MAAGRFGVVCLLVLLPSSLRAAPADKPVTFTKDVAPIFREKCEACHRPDSIAPMALRTFEEARPWARSIRGRVAARQMPPWHLDKTVGIQHFENDRSLSDEQIATILSWVDAGAPQGDPKDMPPPKTWPDENTWGFASQLGQPDLVIKSPAYTMPAQAQDAWWKPVVDTGLKEARWVRAIEIRPSTLNGRRITHHAVARLKQDDGHDISRASSLDIPRPADDVIDVGPGLFMEWAVGKQGEMMRPNTGKLMMPGSQIVWDIHYHAVGQEITDSVELAIYLYPKGQEPKLRTVLGQFQSIPGGSKGNLDIPPNSVSVHQGFVVMKQAGRVENFQPHMHLRGKAMSMEAILPNGSTEMLSHANFEFNWHLNYIYASDAAPILPKGTILRITAWHDNTSANKANPDPSQWVGWGERTVDEMAHAWVNITYMSDEEYKTEIAKRKTSAPTIAQRYNRGGHRVVLAFKLLSSVVVQSFNLLSTVVGQAFRPARHGRPEGLHDYCLVAVLVCLSLGAPSASQLPLEPLKDSGQGVTPAYEGWFKNSDGSFTLLLGYFNRNLKQTLDIPIGPDNRIEPDGPDRGQPTHFLPRRQWGIFTVHVPADFGDKKLTWTIAANGKTASVPVGLHRDYEIEPFKDAANKNTPPVLRFELGGSPLQGPPLGIVATLGTTLPEPVMLTLYASDDGIVTPDRRAGASPVSVSWSLLRGPGAVTFSNAKPAVDKANGKTSTTAAFSVPGEYILRAQANDVSGDGGGGFQCCWTNAHVKVIVKGR